MVVKAQRYFKHHVLSASWAGALLLCPLLGLAGLAQEKPKSAEPISEKQKGAEAAADRVLTRFYETLDFAVIYREMYVSDLLKLREVQIIIGNLLRQGRRDLSVPPIEFPTMERAYIAKRNFDFLVSAENFTDERDESFDKELKPSIEKYYMAMMSPANWPILTSEQLDSRFTANLDQMNEVFRKHVVSKNLGSDLYRQRIASFKESRAPEQGLGRMFGLGQDIYVVQRERLHLYFLEENGQFRMLSVTPRVMD